MVIKKVGYASSGRYKFFAAGSQFFWHFLSDFGIFLTEFPFFMIFQVRIEDCSEFRRPTILRRGVVLRVLNLSSEHDYVLPNSISLGLCLKDCVNTFGKKLPNS